MQPRQQFTPASQPKIGSFSVGQDLAAHVLTMRGQMLFTATTADQSFNARSVLSSTKSSGKSRNVSNIDPMISQQTAEEDKSISSSKFRFLKKEMQNLYFYQWALRSLLV